MADSDTIDIGNSTVRLKSRNAVSYCRERGEQAKVVIGDEKDARVQCRALTADKRGEAAAIDNIRNFGGGFCSVPSGGRRCSKFLELFRTRNYC
jgi:hypothetical protein